MLETFLCFIREMSICVLRFSGYISSLTLANKCFLIFVYSIKAMFMPLGSCCAIDNTFYNKSHSSNTRKKLLDHRQYAFIAGGTLGMVMQESIPTLYPYRLSPSLLLANELLKSTSSSAKARSLCQGLWLTPHISLSQQTRMRNT